MKCLGIMKLAHVAALIAHMTLGHASPVQWSDSVLEEINALRASGMSEVSQSKNRLLLAISPLKFNEVVNLSTET